MKKLYIYFDHKFKCFQVIAPSRYFNGNYKELAESVAGVHPDGSSKIYRWVVK